MYLYFVAIWCLITQHKTALEKHLLDRTALSSKYPSQNKALAEGESSNGYGAKMGGKQTPI